MTLTVFAERLLDDFAVTVVEQRIVDILTAELANQQALATAAAADPTPYQIGVFREREIPSESSEYPLINVSLSDGTFPKSMSGPQSVARMGEFVYHVDCMASLPTEIAADKSVTELGDLRTAKQALFVAGLAYRILSSPVNTLLQFPSRDGTGPIGFIGGSKITTVTAFQPVFSETHFPAEHVLAVRLVLEVKHSVTAPDSVGVPLEGFLATLQNTSGTEVVEQEVELEY